MDSERDLPINRHRDSAAHASKLYFSKNLALSGPVKCGIIVEHGSGDFQASCPNNIYAAIFSARIGL